MAKVVRVDKLLKIADKNLFYGDFIRLQSILKNITVYDIPEEILEKNLKNKE